MRFGSRATQSRKVRARSCDGRASHRACGPSGIRRRPCPSCSRRKRARGPAPRTPAGICSSPLAFVSRMVRSTMISIYMLARRQRGGRLFRTNRQRATVHLVALGGSPGFGAPRSGTGCPHRAACRHVATYAFCSTQCELFQVTDFSNLFLPCYQ